MSTTVELPEQLRASAKEQKRVFSNGIVKLPPPAPKSNEEIEEAMQRLHDAQFDPYVMHMGRRGNIVIPMD